MLELTSDGRSLHVRAAAGFPDDMLGGVLRADAEELSRIALDRDEPVVDRATSARSRTSSPRRSSASWA